MKVKKRSALPIAFACVTGVAMACAVLPFPIPPIPIKVTVVDVAKAMLSGFKSSNALHGALMMKLDEYSSTAVGDAMWKDNFFQGHVSYSTPIGGAGIAYFEKPCNTTAEEKALAAQSSGGGGGGDDTFGGTGTSPYEGCFPIYVPPAEVCVPGVPCTVTDGWTELDCSLS